MGEKCFFEYLEGMMTCTHYVDCPPNAAYPLIGYNAQTNDVQTWAAMGFAPAIPPPLNWNVGLPAGFAIKHSTVSQDDADAAAYAAALFNAQATWTPPSEAPAIVPGDNDIEYMLATLDAPPLS
jgi:hypothetical protein